MRTTTFRRGGLPGLAWAVLAAACGLVLGDAGPAQAQFRSLHAPEQVAAGQPLNLFAAWDGALAFEGVHVELPPGWRLQDAWLLRNGYEDAGAQVQRAPGGENAFVVTTPAALQGHYEMVFQVLAGETQGTHEWSVSPLVRQAGALGSELVRREAYRAGQRLRVEPAAADEQNRVLAFLDRSGAPLLLRAGALPDLGLRAGYTIEAWLKTTGLNQVVLSTWDGDERRPYPLELVVDRSGRLYYYRGQPGRHQSMMSRRPVADGQWHHVAVVHDGANGWTHFYLDGAPVDSLYRPSMPDVRVGATLAVGGRVPASEPATTAMAPYAGMIDEVRFWGVARSPAALRRTMRQTVESRGRQVVSLSFEGRVPAALLDRSSTRAERTGADLAFYQGVRDLRALMEDGGVMLTWATRDLQTAAFVVERSEDGVRFREVGRVDATAAVRPGTGTALYRYRDADASGRVLFYRLRQQFASGAERVSPVIKLGMGAEQPNQAELIGNFPNPFNASTTITYEVRESQRIRLSVWDLSGQQVALLADEEQPPGYYEVRFEANDLPSGTYFIRLELPSGMESRKMILMK